MRSRPRRSTIRIKHGCLDIMGLPAISQGRISTYFCIHSQFARLLSQVPHNLGLSGLRPHTSSDAISDSKPRRDNSFLTAGTCASAPQVSGGYYAEMDQYVSEYKIHQ